jgi:arylsulfatase A-like enzyme
MKPVSRRAFLAQTGAGLVFAQAPAPRRPNILWLSYEDAGPQLGCYGDPHAVTPVVDRLASQGVRYTRAHTVAGVCAPSRSGIITGMYPSTLGSGYMRCNAPLPDFVRCFTEYLREAGYYCTNNAKTDYNFAHPASAWDESSRTAHWKNRPSDRPFFAVFNHEVTHEGQIRLRGAAFEKLVARLTPAQRRDPAALRLPPYYPDTPPARRDWANYYETITAMDYQVGARLKELEDAGLLEDTIVFFWGDHGVGLPRAKRWLYESGTHVGLVIRVPEKFRTGSQGRPGSVDSQLVSFLDLAPTVLNLGGVPLPPHFQGRAFLGSNLTPPRQYVYAARDRMDERYDNVRMVRDRRFRYLRNYEPHKPYAQITTYMEQGPTMQELRRLHREGNLPPAARLYMGDRKPVEELYDVENDPHEIRNLAESPEHRSELERLRAVHEKWAFETRDLGLIPEPEVDERGKKLGSRYAILRQPGSEDYLRRLRALVDAVNRGTNPALRERALGDPDPAFRYWAMVSFTRTPAAVQENRERIGAGLKDAAAIVRIVAARAAAEYLQDASAVALLAQELKGSNEWARLQAMIALDELGERARPARDAIQAATKDPNDYVQRVARHALGG